MSADPALGEYIPGAPINDQVKKQNQNLPGMGGVFNVVNMHLYHYAGNNPVKYLDPDGNQSIPSFGLQDMWSVISQFDPLAKMTNLFGAALSGDKQAQAYAGMIIHQVGRETLKDISAGSSTASILFLAVGAPEFAGAASAVGAVANGLLALDDLRTGNIAEGVGGLIFTDAAIGLGKLAIGTSKKLFEGGLKISIGRNNLYYSIGRRGALKTWDATRTLLLADIAEYNLPSIATTILVDVAKQAYDAAVEALNEY